jgi:hypothetical protein
MDRQKLILGACIGECIHVAGILSFLKIAEQKEYDTTFLGGAVLIEKIILGIRILNPDIVAISYRLSPETADIHLQEFIQTIEKEGLKNGRIFAFGGTEPVAQIARKFEFFDAVFGGKSTDEDVSAFLEGRNPENKEEYYASTLLSRIRQKSPMPIIRHHYGRPTFEETLGGVKQIAEAGVLDIISLGIDQDAQENFFHPERQNPSHKGAGGVPVRSPEQFRMLYDASMCGNYPLMRSYAGTSDLIRLAQVYQDTIKNCFAAIPIFWFNKIDGRGPMELVESIEAHKEAIKWHAERNVPVEVNDPHHWSLRGAHDTIYVATSFLSAYIAKKMGVNDYIMQLMFNTPPETSFKMDLAKMLAAIELVEEMQNDDFIVHRETRAGLMSYPTDPYMAKGQLASSIMLQMSLNPEIIHVVAYCEADHATTAEEAIESCLIARKVMENTVWGMPDMTIDPDIQYRKNYLKDEAMLVINAIRELGENSSDDPLLDPENLANAIRLGILDAPQIIPSNDTKGELATQVIGGACYAVEDGEIISETERLSRIFEYAK